MNTDTDIKPKFIAVRIDESEHCETEFLARCGGKLYGVYVYDENERTYLCEATPSYCLHLVEYSPEKLPENEKARDALIDELMDIGYESEEISYMHCSTVDRLPKDMKDETLEKHQEHEDIDDAIEYYRGNPTW